MEDVFYLENVLMCLLISLIFFFFFCFQLLIAAYDPKNPTNKGYANATITVTLNPNPPITQAFKEVNISDTTQRGAEIAKIVASDPDGVRCFIFFFPFFSIFYFSFSSQFIFDPFSHPSVS